MRFDTVNEMLMPMKSSPAALSQSFSDSHQLTFSLLIFVAKNSTKIIYKVKLDRTFKVCFPKGKHNSALLVGSDC